VSDRGGQPEMNCLKPLLCLVSVLATSLSVAPVAAAAPEQFTLGVPAAVSSSLPAAPAVKAKPSKQAASSQPAKPTKAAKPAKPKASAKAKASKPVATKSKSRKAADVIASDIPPAKLDLSLPKDMVNQLQPPGQAEAVKPLAPQATADGKPLLPSLFAPKDGAEPFQLNGRLLTNEMDLQLRNDSRREVDGAALDFKFKQ